MRRLQRRRRHVGRYVVSRPLTFLSKRGLLGSLRLRLGRNRLTFLSLVSSLSSRR